MKLLIFNPEHDLCLANGGADFVPPRSAVDFARGSASTMQCLYADGLCLSAYDPLPAAEVSEVVPWGWNLALKKRLQKAGIAERLLPTDEELALWRTLQHRQTILPLQPDAYSINKVEDVHKLLEIRPKWVLKAPWSGAGRGLHWIDGTLSPNDRAWLQKVAAQGCVVAEPWHRVRADFALEYYVAGGDLHFVGYSLFSTRHGVYSQNQPIADSQILSSLKSMTLADELENAKAAVEQFVIAKIALFYRGPLGVDFVADHEGRVHVCEINLRHTMGMAALSKFKVES